MPNRINNVTVIGAGTMGASIAGLLANAGVPVTLLDMAPTELLPEEAAAGLTLEQPKVRNRIVTAGFQRMTKLKPANLFSAQTAELIRLGNLTDDFEAAVRQSDWVIEVIVERPQPKQELMARIEAIAPAHTIITTNTSGIPIHMISQGRGAEFKRRFFGTHFFNPPRYLHLLEIIPTADTDPALVAQMREFAETRLGKGVVICKDTPNFVANRMISFLQSDIMEFAIANGYTVEEVDRLTGPLLGRPRTGTFRLNDVVGVDVMALVGENLYEMIAHDADREILRAPLGTAVMQTLTQNKLLGNKTGQGFYKTVTDEKGRKEFWGLDLQTAAESGQIDYMAPAKPRWESVGAARDLPLPQRLQRLTDADDPAGELIWHTLAHTMAYATKRIPEIADSLVSIDNAMRWGFGWELGLFETWDVLGVRQTLARMEGEGITVAEWVHQMLDSGCESFYTYDGGQRMAYDIAAKRYLPVEQGQLVCTVQELRHANRPLAENDSATLHDMGDGVLLAEFHSKMNAIDPDIWKILNVALEHLHGDAAGLVIGNEGANFSVGANIMLVAMAAQAGMWDEVAAGLKLGQDTLMKLRTAPKPVVAAPFNMALGGGAETVMAADRVVAHAESYIGLVEFGVGIVPGWGGCKEMVRRRVSSHMHAANVNPSPYLQQVFEQIGFAKVSGSAVEACEMGFLCSTDRIVMNRDHLLATARNEVLHMQSDYTPPTVTGNVYAAGKDQLANLRIGVYMLKEGGHISAHDAKIADRLAHVLCGGELSAPAWMDEQYFLDLEREALLSLAGEAKTQERIWYMLQNNKPLRN
ncbi:MAG: 3-hydroxyacyl-CoA dehydrogenase/enoyl-CoA hydratase family protein [Caldilineaceae bacterium]|nr:3-hydroxyacyl-CoA dehydrogenase/enoyl-CoA hydratase family protein [Caldilineaceae bacterium]